MDISHTRTWHICLQYWRHAKGKYFRKILTNGIYESTLHRVINKSHKYRVCVAYFYEPNFDAAIEPLDACVQKTGGIRNFEAAVYGKHLVSKVLTNFVS
ncbi:hypothetical protein OROMI_028781 [Orobanche minor]